MAKQIIFVEQNILDNILNVKPVGAGLKYETQNCIYYAIDGPYYNNKKEMPTKHMTQAEAIALVKNKVFGLTDTGQAAKWIDFFISAGMLEIKEVKVPEYVVIKDRYNITQEVKLLEIVKQLEAIGYVVNIM